MAVVWVKQLAGRDGGKSGGAGADRRYTLLFAVRTNSPSDDASVVLAASGIPQPGQAYGGDTRATVTDVTATEVKRGLWNVRATFSTPPLPTPPAGSTGSPASQVENPLLRPPTWGISFTTYPTFPSKDKDGKAFANSVGQPFMLEVPEVVTILKVTRSEASWSVGYALDYNGSVNSDVFAGAQPGQARLYIGGVSSQYDEAIGHYVDVSYEIHFKPEGWTTKVTDIGTLFKNEDGKLVEGLSDRGLPQTEINLDGNGGKLEPADPPVTIDFRFHDEMPFSSLGLPEPFDYGEIT